MGKKRILLICLGIFVLLLGIAIAIPFFVHLSDYRDEIAQKASEAIGRKVNIEGDISLSILPMPHVSIEKITVASIPGTSEPYLAKLAQLRVSIEFWPLFKKQIRVRSVTLQSPDIQLENNNWALEFKKNSGDSSSFKLSLDEVYIEDGRVIYTASGKKTRIKDMDLSVKLGSLDGPYDVKGSLYAFEKEIKLDAQIANFSKLIPYTVALEIGSEAVKSSGQIARTDHSIQLQQALIEARGAKIMTDLDVDWQNDLKLGGTFKNLPGQGQVTVNATQQNSTWTGTLTANFATLKGLYKEAPAALQKPLQLKTDFAYAKTLQLHKLSLSIENARIQGSASWYPDRNTNHITAQITSPSFENLLQLVNSKLPSSMLAGAFAFSGDIVATSKQFSVSNLNTTFGSGLNLRGSVDGNLVPERPVINAKLMTSPITLEANSSPTSGAPWSQTPIDLSALKKLDGQFEINTSKITRKDLVFSNPRISAKIQNGTLTINPFAALVYGGELLVQATVTSDGAYTLKSTLKNADVQKLASSDSKMTLVSGRLSLTTDLNTQGKSTYDLASHLNGTVLLDSKNGTINGFDLEAIAQRLSNLDSLESILGLLQTALAKGQTPFKTYNGNIVFNNGIGTIRSMTLETTRAKGTATGTINLPPYTLNIFANLEVTNPAGLPTFGMRLTGPLDNPTRQSDFSNLRDYLIKNITKKVIEGVPSLFNKLLGR